MCPGCFSLGISSCNHIYVADEYCWLLAELWIAARPSQHQAVLAHLITAIHMSCMRCEAREVVGSGLVLLIVHA